MKMSAQERFNKACEETNSLRKNIYKLNDTIFGKEIVSGTLIDAIMMLPKNQKEKFINDIALKAKLISDDLCGNS